MESDEGSTLGWKQEGMRSCVWLRGANGGDSEGAKAPNSSATAQTAAPPAVDAAPLQTAEQAALGVVV